MPLSSTIHRYPLSDVSPIINYGAELCEDSDCGCLNPGFCEVHQSEVALRAGVMAVTLCWQWCGDESVWRSALTDMHPLSVHKAVGFLITLQRWIVGLSRSCNCSYWIVAVIAGITSSQLHDSTPLHSPLSPSSIKHIAPPDLDLWPIRVHSGQPQQRLRQSKHQQHRRPSPQRGIYLYETIPPSRGMARRRNTSDDGTHMSRPDECSGRVQRFAVLLCTTPKSSDPSSWQPTASRTLLHYESTVEVVGHVFNFSPFSSPLFLHFSPLLRQNVCPLRPMPKTNERATQNGGRQG